MIKQTIQAMAFGKKTYAKPQMKAYQVESDSIICASVAVKPSTQTEEYEEESTSDWF